MTKKPLFDREALIEDILRDLRDSEKYVHIFVNGLPDLLQGRKLIDYVEMRRNYAAKQGDYLGVYIWARILNTVEEKLALL